MSRGGSLRTKLLVGLTGFTLVLVSLMVVFFDVKATIDASVEEQARIFRAVELGFLLDIDALKNNVAIERYVDNPSPANIARIEEYRRRSQEHRAELRMITQITKVESALDMYESLLPERIHLAERIVVAVERSDGEEVISELLDERIRLDERASLYLDTIVMEEQQALENIIATNETLRDRISSILVMAIVVLLLMLVVSVLFVYRTILRSISMVTSAIDAISQGDYSYPLETERDDEVGILMRMLQKLVMEVSKQSESLHSEVDTKSSEIERQLETVTLQNAELEKTRKGMLNVLEDMEVDKQKLEDQFYETQKFAMAVAATSEQVVITDASGTVLYANAATEKNTGYTVAEALGTKAGTLWGGEMDEWYYKDMWNTIALQKRTFEGEITNRRKNGDLYIATISISPVLDAEQNVMFFVAIERDITHEKEVDRAKTEFVSLASHQLRTPLSAINWYIEMVTSGDAGEVNDDQKKLLDEAYTASRRMVDLVNALLNVSRIELGTFAVDPENIDIVKLCKELVHEIEPLAMQKQQRLQESYVEESLMIDVDPKLFTMIIQNLLSNAIKYTPEEGTVALSVRKEDGLLQISVTDTGYGIPTSEQDKIFTKLFRADNVKDKDTTGTGLGLYIVKSILEYSGGNIWFESPCHDDGTGTTFFVTLPLSGMKSQDGSKPLEE